MNETRDILDKDGNKVGELSPPEGVTWTEEEWAEKLAAYSRVQPRFCRDCAKATGSDEAGWFCMGTLINGDAAGEPCFE